jgi:toxin ParE1/3/4
VGRYRLRPRARDDLAQIWDYSSRTWSPDRADDYVREIRDTVARLAEHPQAGQAAEHIATSYRKQRSGSHIIFYVVRSYGIEVVRILHGRMDLPAHLGKR